MVDVVQLHQTGHHELEIFFKQTLLLRKSSAKVGEKISVVVMGTRRTTYCSCLSICRRVRAVGVKWRRLGGPDRVGGERRD